ncbi:methylcrotonoyl-CoA carboxylase [Variovorax paradoxus]|jgi:3-methylcrotonyl-CoA carboxylase beta subunit|uniref:acyl-CoA carboxylase subunit beta n=1 Tax=Variovorax paradoxus TaxID=34073 RepID=UPI0006E5C182|nr:methylcrotonoyl-CoA carboxylase [Variovorax paradoxus]KPV03408.1 methylcrotonoyl-CoA carboxylase [Variovorax paradoxus]KPV04691.1 methylcrotonoyl-CoA carboxylase [Variovorax paradoxus]KPV19201.1 methylcrotonoyl-CoA carboxylase [Variovorax paradoxus]KPV30213.1 methylcrotonoyl-CoA carboxylase [Variovorax paradoxus]
MSTLRTRLHAGSAAFETNAAHQAALVGELRERHRTVLAGGGVAMAARHHARDKILVRDRIDLLVDPLTAFLELSPLAAWGQYGNEVHSAGIVTGIGVVSGTPCMIIANDATVKGGSFFHETVKKHVRAQEIAEENRLPVVYLVDCGGAYLPEQDRVFPDKDHFGNTFYRQCRMSASGLAQISAVFGGCTAGGAYIPALSDEVVMVRGQARIHLGGPQIVKAAINEIVDGETLGGAEMHVKVSGVADYLADNEAQALQRVREIVRTLNRSPRRHGALQPPRAPLHDTAELAGVLPADPKLPYDVRELIARLVDGSQFQEFKPDFGSTLVCGFAHWGGHPVGILANNGVLFSESAIKGAHFIELCNQRNVPMLFLQNITGFMVGTEAERGGIARHSAKLVYAMATARVPRLTVIIGGSYGAGNYGMCGRGFAPRFLFAWPNSRIATMSPDVASTVLTELRRSSSKGHASEEDIAQIDRQTRAQFTEQSDPYYATSRLWDDGIIEPEQTREVIALCLAIIATEPPVEGPSPIFRM